MARLTLTTAQVTQLNDWLNGGPTDPVGLIAWLAAHPELAGTPVYQQALGERDLYQLLLSKNNQNLRSQDLTPLMTASLTWVADSLQADQDAGRPIPLNQEQMRALWKWVQSQ
jgi:hypothetical protein